MDADSKSAKRRVGRDAVLTEQGSRREHFEWYDDMIGVGDECRGRLESLGFSDEGQKGSRLEDDDYDKGRGCIIVHSQKKVTGGRHMLS